MSDLDQISMMFGEIKSDLRHAIRWFDEHEAEDQQRFELLTARIDAGNHVRSRVEQVERDLEAAKPVLQGITNAKWVVIGVMITVGAIGGAFGGWALSVAKLFV